MKKLIAIFLLLSVALPLYGCVPNYPADTFYGAELLAEYNLSDLPVPKLENSRLGGESLYCNLTVEEYESYVAGLLAYLRGRADIHHLSYQCSRYLLAEMVPVDVCAPLPEDYDHTGDQHRFVFTYTEELHDDRIADPIRISVTRQTDTLFRTDFTYNTVIQLQPTSSIPAELDYCAGEHTYDDGYPYPVPGLDRSITIRKCIHCGGKTQSDYIGSGNNKLYAVTVTEGRAHILRNNWNQVQSWDIDSLYAGQTLEITTPIPENGTMQMLVNGESIPALWTEGNTQTFGFIMPEADVEIQLRIVTDDGE